MKINLWLVFRVLLLVAVYAPTDFGFAAESRASSGDNQGAPPPRLALNWKPEPQFGGFYAAQFKAQLELKTSGIDILIGGSGTPTIQMLSSGTVEYAIVSGEEIIIANERHPKSPVVAVFATFQANPQILMTHKERGFKSMKDIFKSPGTLAMQQGLSYALFLKRKFAPFVVTMVPYSGGVGQFLGKKDHSQQGFLTSESLIAEAKGASPQIFRISDEGFNPYTTVLATTAKRLANSPKEVAAVVKAVRLGWQEYLNDPAPTHARMAKLNPAISLQTWAASAEAQKSLIQGSSEAALGLMTKARWAELNAQLKDLGLVKGTLEPDKFFKNIQ